MHRRWKKKKEKNTHTYTHAHARSGFTRAYAGIDTAGFVALPGVGIGRHWQFAAVVWVMRPGASNADASIKMHGGCDARKS